MQSVPGFIFVATMLRSMVALVVSEGEDDDAHNGHQEHHIARRRRRSDHRDDEHVYAGSAGCTRAS